MKLEPTGFFDRCKKKKKIEGDFIWLRVGHD